jgi:hypothetical protein
MKGSDLRIRKDSSPFTGGFLEILGGGLEVTVPITDDNLYRMIALKMGQEMPIYF